MDDSVEDPRVRISRLTAEIDTLAQPDDLPSMILSGNAVRRSEYLEAANQKQSELIAAYGEYTARLEGLVAAAIDIQSELTEILRMQSEMMPEGPRRARAGGGSGGGKKRGGQAAQRTGRQGAGKSAGAGSPRAASAAQPKRKRPGAGSPRAASAAQPKRKRPGAGSPRAASAAQPKRKRPGAGKKASAGGRRGR